MIASNYVKHPEAMQHQRELWSKSKRDTIMMRIAGLIMRGGKVPAWVIEAKRKARELAKAVQGCCRDWISEDHARRQNEGPDPTGFRAHLRSVNRAAQAAKDKLCGAVVARAFGFVPVFTYSKR